MAIFEHRLTRTWSTDSAAQLRRHQNHHTRLFVRLKGDNGQTELPGVGQSPAGGSVTGNSMLMDEVLLNFISNSIRKGGQDCAQRQRGGSQKGFNKKRRNFSGGLSCRTAPPLRCRVRTGTQPDTCLESSVQKRSVFRFGLMVQRPRRPSTRLRRFRPCRLFDKGYKICRQLWVDLAAGRQAQNPGTDLRRPGFLVGAHGS